MKWTTANACTILDVLERDVPVFAGCGGALIAKDRPDGSDAFGQDGLGDSGYPPSRRKAVDEHAVHALIRLANASPGELAGQHVRGHTAVDWFDITGQEPNVNLVLEVDTERFQDLMQAAIR